MTPPRVGFLFLALASMQGCEQSELWRHQQETYGINARLPYKEQYLSSLQAQQSSLGQQESMLRQRADAASATLDELNEELARLDRQVVADRRSNRKLRYNANSTSRRVKQLKVELASLQERQAESSSTGRVDPELEAQVRRKKQEVEALLKVVIQQ